MGLSHRYGRRMQTISGIHYNFSLPVAAWPALAEEWAPRLSADACRDDGYFALIRNFRRHSWLLLYLFGASPAVSRCFVEHRDHPLAELGAGTLYLPYATSLRMGPLGYQSDAQASLTVSYNSLRDYARSLQRALTEPYAPYEAIGIRGPEGYRQLATTLLQIENEFYGTIRPKHRIRRGERPLRVLSECGVEYVEVRCMDIDPFLPIGIDARTMRFLDVFLLHCLLEGSALDTPEELADCAINRHRVALRGRQPGLVLRRHGREVFLTDWARELIDGFGPIAEALDAACGSDDHRRSLLEARDAVADPARTPSARVLRAMGEDHGHDFIAFALDRTQAHRAGFLGEPLAPELVREYEAMAAESCAEQRRLEASDCIDFETWRLRYLDQDLLGSEGAARA
jgi:glutamate--cysteine ligase